MKRRVGRAMRSSCASGWARVRDAGRWMTIGARRTTTTSRRPRRPASRASRGSSRTPRAPRRASLVPWAPRWLRQAARRARRATRVDSPTPRDSTPAPRVRGATRSQRRGRGTAACVRQARFRCQDRLPAIRAWATLCRVPGPARATRAPWARLRTTTPPTASRAPPSRCTVDT